MSQAAHGRVNGRRLTGFENGFRAGDVITAVDGIRVTNFPQYRAARGASDADRMLFTIWRDGVSKDVAAPLRHRWIVSTLRTYDPGAAAK